MNYIIKVADFGLSVTLGTKDYFRQSTSDTVKLPIKWMAIESLNDSVFSEKSDMVIILQKYNTFGIHTIILWAQLMILQYLVLVITLTFKCKDTFLG